VITGHEEEFRQLFAQEAEQRLASLGRQLLELEQTGGDDELVASIFRDAHTLKGSAAMVAVDEVARVAHSMEDLLEQLRSGERPATPDLIDTLLVVVDGLTAIIPSVLDGHDRSVDADALVQLLHVAAIGGSSEAATPAAHPTEFASSADVVAASVHPVTDRRRRTDVDTVMVPVSRLDELVRLVGESASAHLRIGRMLAERLAIDPGTVPELRSLSLVLNDLQERTMRARMVPVATITDSLQRAVRDLARALDKVVHWEVRGGETELDRNMLGQLADPLLHLVRNAVDHGVESSSDRLAAGKPEQAELVLHAMQLGPEVIITVIDDGRGIDVEKVRAKAAQRGIDVAPLSDEESLNLIFRSGLSTARTVSNVSGRGVGLDVVRASVDAVRGRIEVTSTLGRGSEFRIVVPMTLAVLPCLLVRVGTERYAIPMHSVVVAQASASSLEAHAGGQPMVWVGRSTVAVSSLAATLGGSDSNGGGDSQVVVVASATRQHAFRIDTLIGQRDVVVKGLGGLLPRLDVLAGASVEPDGSILLVLDAPGLIDRARMTGPGGGAVADDAAAPVRRGTVLVVDDALTIRELERSILERAGFEVCTAADGLQALDRLVERSFDLVLTDVEMPGMDGLALTEAIRANPSSANLPVILLTTRASDDDRRRGLEAGADGYIVKSAFDEAALLSVIDRFLGGPR